jgi:hypothetical protein
MAITSCFECGASISDSASRCPQCGSRFPFGVNCQCCRTKLRESRAFFLKRVSGIVCDDCGSRLFSATPACHECGHLFSVVSWKEMLQSLVSSVPSCPKCGASSALNHKGTCKYCRLPVALQLHAARYLSGTTDAGDRWSECWHNDCRPAQHTVIILGVIAVAGVCLLLTRACP